MYYITVSKLQGCNYPAQSSPFAFNLPAETRGPNAITPTINLDNSQRSRHVIVNAIIRHGRGSRGIMDGAEGRGRMRSVKVSFRGLASSPLWMCTRPSPWDACSPRQWGRGIPLLALCQSSVDSRGSFNTEISVLNQRHDSLRVATYRYRGFSSRCRTTHSWQESLSR